LHLHFYGNLAELLPDELHLHFHAEPPAGPPAGARTIAPRRLLGHEIYQPAASARVRDDGSGTTGHVCSCGFATHPDGHALLSVRAQVFDHAPSQYEIDGVPHNGVVGLVIYGDPNYVFDHRAGSAEIPNAVHSSAGTANWLVVYPCFDVVGFACPQEQQFNGVTDYLTECQAGNACQDHLLKLPKQSLAKLPAKVVVEPDPAVAVADKRIAGLAGKFKLSLIRDDHQGQALDPTWTSCPKQQQIGDAVLWVAHTGAKFHATLVLRSILGKDLKAPLVYRCADWRPDGANAFVADPPSRSAEFFPRLLVKPV
jgi:hypothetical protein